MKNTEQFARILKQLQSEHAYLIMLKALFDASADIPSNVLARRIRQHSQFNSVATLESFGFEHDFQYLEAFHNFRTATLVSAKEAQLPGFDGLQLSAPDTVDAEQFNTAQTVLHESFNSICQEIADIILDKNQLREIPLELRQIYVITKLREKVLQFQNSLNALNAVDSQQSQSVADKLFAAQYAIADLMEHCREYCGAISKSSPLLQAIKVTWEQVCKVKNQLTDSQTQLGKTNNSVAGASYQAVGFPYLMAVPGLNKNLSQQDYDAYTERFIAAEQNQQQAAQTQQYDWLMRPENRLRYRLLAKTGVAGAAEDTPLPPVSKLVL